MSMIEKIRNRQGLLIVMIGFGMLGFLVPYDAVMALIGQGGNRDVGEVNGREISALEYQSELQERRRLGFNGDQLSEEVWNDLTTGIILNDDFDALGLTVSDNEYQEMLFGSGFSPYMNRAFYSNSENKQFWQQNFGAMLNTPKGKSDFMAYKALISDKRVREKYDNMVNAGIYANSLEGEADYLQANRKVTFQYVLKSYASIPDSTVSVSDSDVKSFYNAHKSDVEYKETDGRSVTYARIAVKASADDALAIEADLNSLKTVWESTAESDSQFVATVNEAPFQPMSLKFSDVETDVNEATFFDSKEGDLVGPYLKNQSYRLARVMSFSSEPDSVSCRHILLQATNPSDASEMDALMARADSLKRALRRGAKFENLVTEFSSDPGSMATGGFYDFFTRGRMTKAFEDFCFENKPGKIGAVKTQYGVHLIEVMEHTASKSRVSIAMIERPLEPSSETSRSAYSAASEFAISTSDKESFMQSAGEAGYPTNIAKDIRRQANSVSGLRSARELVSWSFNAVEGEVSNPILIDDTYVVAFLDQVSKNGVPAFDHVEDRMRTGAIREAKANLYADLMATGTMEEVAAAIGGQVLTASDVALKFPTLKGAGALPEPEVVGTAFAIEVGNMSQPIIGANGVWVVAPSSIREAAEKTDFLSEQSSALARARGAATLRISNAMLEAADLEDNRGAN